MKKLTVTLFLNIAVHFSFAQMALQLSGEVNSVCNGTGCNYSGPSILINEVMLKPFSGDGSIFGPMSYDPASGEWIELYNPDKCKSVDISCYFLGNNAWDNQTGSNNYPGGFSIPPGTVVPPQGFAVVRGVNATPVPSHLLVANGGKTVEIVVNSRICLGGGARLWFPNAGGWFAFYDANGIPQDAISWGYSPNSCMTCPPCNPMGNGCSYSGSLPSYSDIPAEKRTIISHSEPASGASFRRVPDGGNWAVNDPASPTLGTCNAICDTPIIVTCTGKATVTVSGGTQPYRYVWSDGQVQTNATAVGLCAGTYCVTVTDAALNTQAACYTVENHTPTVSHDDMGLCGNETTVELTGGIPAGGVYSGAGVAGQLFTAYGNLEIYPVMYGYTDNNECHNSAAFSVRKIAIPEVTLNYPDTICRYGVARLQVRSGAEPVNITISENSHVLSTDHLSGNTLRSYDLYPDKTTQYSIYLTSSNCENEDAFKIVVLNSPVVEISGLTRIPEELVGKSDLSVSPVYASYRWNTGDSTASIKVLEEGLYSVTVTNNFGCQKSDEIEVFIIPKDVPVYLPNAFIPSSSNMPNNYFFATGLENYFDISVHIFNRWGEQIFQSHDPYFKWDGTLNGKACPQGVYIWELTYFNYFGKQYKMKGHITLIR